MNWTIYIGWPPAILNPNDRTHPAKKARPRRIQKNEGFWAAQEAKIPTPWHDGRVGLRVDFFPPRNEGTQKDRDEDNFIGSCKGAIDGIAKAIKINDRRFRLIPHMHEPIDGLGRVYFTVIDGPFDPEAAIEKLARQLHRLANEFPRRSAAKSPILKPETELRQVAHALRGIYGGPIELSS